MLKGILFVVAIIITFDIGKALLKSWQAEEEAAPIVKEVSVEPAKTNQSDLDEAESDKALEDVPVLINLELPEETTDAYAEELEQEASDKKTSTSYTSPQKLTKKEKKVSLNAKPILIFDEESIEKPQIDGATVGIKIELD